MQLNKMLISDVIVQENGFCLIKELQEKLLQDCDVFKSKLIDEGIRGNLTEQLPEDGTAEELYVSVIEEKKQIVKDRKGREYKRVR